MSRSLDFLRISAIDRAGPVSENLRISQSTVYAGRLFCGDVARAARLNWRQARLSAEVLPDDAQESLSERFHDDRVDDWIDRAV